MLPSMESYGTGILFFAIVIFFSRTGIPYDAFRLVPLGYQIVNTKMATTTYLIYCNITLGLWLGLGLRIYVTCKGMSHGVNVPEVLEFVRT